MIQQLVMSEEEIITGIVYGDTFALYDEKAFDEFVEPFRVRFKANGIDTAVFNGAKCLDAGCGGGRGSVFMAQCGAREVIGIDLSDKNVESSRKRASQKGLDHLSFQQGSLAELPFEDESFDAVWCNGVLHHSQNPDRGLTEITRVLKTGGHLWLYLYGSGGIYWFVIDWIRDMLRGTSPRDCIYMLRLMDTPVRRIGEWVDDWHVPYLRRYTVDAVTNRLKELGYENTDALQGGTGYDTSQRKVGASGSELALMGEGDVRHFCRKVHSPTGHSYALPDPPDGKGSPYVDGPEVQQFGELLAAVGDSLSRLQTRMGHEMTAEKILVCRSIHSHVRSQLEGGALFDVDEFRQHLCRLTSVLENLKA